MEEKKVLLSVKDLVVKFRVRGRILTAIRGISLDIREDESIAIVGESGSGKSVFTKTFAGMLDENGFIDNGSIVFNDDTLSDTVVNYKSADRARVNALYNRLNAYSHAEHGASIYAKLQALEAEKAAKGMPDAAEVERINDEIADLTYKRTELFNVRQTVDSSKEKERLKAITAEMDGYDARIKELKATLAAKTAAAQKALAADTEFLNRYRTEKAALTAEYHEACKQEITDAVKDRNMLLAKEIYLSVGRFSALRRQQMISKLMKGFCAAMVRGEDLTDVAVCDSVFENVIFHVRYLDETEEKLHGTAVVNLAKMKYPGDWMQVRGRRIATVFQDPMTSLNPIITIGKQITSIIIKHQGCSETEARERALILMKKVGIPNAEKRFDDYPFQYSGGMRQRIVIAIALSCQPKILICDEPTTALDVTIQAQILKLLKDLQKEFHYTIVFITHDLGVVANVADRVAVLYAGQIAEVGTVDEVFYDPRHPYTWALLSSLPQLAQKNTELFCIHGTPPSLYNKIVGDPFAPRNPYCLQIDTMKEPPMFQISDTHYARTWLLDPRSPKVEKPEIICNIHEKLMNAFNI